MINKCFFYTLAVLFAFTESKAQDNTVMIKDNAIKVSATAFIASSFVLSYERKIKSNLSLQFTGGITAREKDPYYYSPSMPSYLVGSKDKVIGFNLEGALRVYLIQQRYAMSGIYASPYARYQNLDFTVLTDTYSSITSTYVYQSVNYTLTMYEAGFLFGYQWVISDLFILDTFIGGCLKYSESDKPIWYNDYNYSFDTIENLDYTGVAPRGGLRLGFKF